MRITEILFTLLALFGMVLIGGMLLSGCEEADDPTDPVEPPTSTPAPNLTPTATPSGTPPTPTASPTRTPSPTPTYPAGYILSLTAEPDELPAGLGVSVLTAELRQNGNLVDGALIYFSSSIGTLGNQLITTTNGKAVTTLSSFYPGVADVCAVFDIIGDCETVTFLP